jgi:phosphatidylglycerol:prolipoprotein diacylglycerol transferase
MLPTLLEWPVPIRTYGLLIATAFLLGLFFMQRDAKRFGINPDVIGNLALYGLLAGIVGARLAFIFMFPEQFSWSRPLEWIAIWQGGLVFQGAIIPCLLVAVWYLCKHQVNFWQAADAVVPYLALGHAIGRMGCFFSGCCYGAVTTVPWGLRFPRIPGDIGQNATGSPAFREHAKRFAEVGHDALWSLPVHPTQLYSFCALMALCLILLILRKYWNPVTGFTLPLYFILYGSYRFLVEFIRDDSNPAHFGGFLTDQQVFALVSVACGAALFAYLLRRKKHVEPLSPGTAET